MTRQKIKSILRGEFFKNATILTMGTTIAQLSNVVLYPILSRIYSVEDFADLATVMSITSIMSVAITGKYESSVITSKDKKEAINICALSILLASLLLGLMTVLLVLFPSVAESLSANSNILFILYISIISSFAIVVFNVFNEWCVFNKYFKPLAYNKINNSLAVSLSKLVFGFVPGLKNALIYGDSVGRWLSAGGCMWRLLWLDRKILSEVKMSQIKRLAARYANFPKYVMPAQLINALSSAVPVLFIGYYFTSTELGYYSMAMNILILPISLISNSIRDVFRQKASVVYRSTGDCRPLMLKIFKPLCLIGLAVVLISYFFIPDVFSIVLGEKWRMSGVFTQYLIFFIYFDFLAMAFSGILLVTEKTKELLFWQIFHLVSALASLYASIIGGISIEKTLIFFTIGRVVSYILLLAISYKCAFNGALSNNQTQTEV